MNRPPADAASNRVRLIELDGLKGISTSFVVAAHIEFRPLFWTWTWMDMFFVLSSFLLTRIAYRKCIDFKGVVSFYGRRIERIWPLYFLTLSVLFLIAIALNWHRGYASLDLTAFARLFTFSQYSELLFQPVADANIIPFAHHTWSLAIEEQFYLLLPLDIWALRRSPASLWLTVLAAVIVVSVRQRLATPNMFILTNHLDSFALGGLLAVVVQELGAHARRLKQLLSALLLTSLLLFSAYLIDGYATLLDHGPTPGYQAWPATFSSVFWACAIGLLALNQGDAALAILRWPPLIYIGNASYAIYLVHYPILKLVAPQIVTSLPGLSLVAAKLLCLPAILLLADLAYRKIDRPLQQRRPTNLRPAAV